MKERNIEEAIVDRILLLYLIARTRQKGYNISGQIKLQKMLFKTEERMFLSRYKGLNYNFIRWDYGPFSPEIYFDVRDLKETGLLRDKDTVDISEIGLQLLNALTGLLDKNRKFKEIIDRVINEFGPLKGRQIKDVMYSYPKIGEKKLIAETKKGEIILPKLEATEAEDRFWIDERLFETFRILLDPSSNKSTKEGLEALKKEEGKPFIPVLE
jgi:uncharacterized phage-associated protein